MTRTNGKTRVRLGLWGLSGIALFFICTGPAATLAQAQARNKAYVASTTDNSVSVIDTTTKTVVPDLKIPVGVAPVHVVFSLDARFAYVANTGESSVTKIDATTDTVSDTIPLTNPPASIAVSPSGDTLYVMEATGDLEFINIVDHSAAAPSLKIGTTGGDIAITPDGNLLYVAAGDVTIVSTTGTPAVKTTFSLDSSEDPNVFNSAVSVAISSKGIPYIGFTSYDFAGLLGFTATGGIRVLDPAHPATIPLFSLPGSLSIAADDSLIFAGIDYFWENSLYGAAFFPGRIIITSDTVTAQLIGFTDLLADGPLWNQQHTAAGLAVTPDRSTVLVTIPSKDSVAVVDVVTNGVTFLTGLGGPKSVAVAPDPSAVTSALTIDAVNDVVALPLPALGIGPAVSNVLANDTLGGRPAAVGNVTPPKTLVPSQGITLNPATGAVSINPDAAVGSHTLTYEICEVGHETNCDHADVTLTVRDRYQIAASGEAASAFPGTTAIPNVLLNDSFNGGIPNLAAVKFSQVTSSDLGITLDTANGSVSVASDATFGEHWVSYGICEIASPTNCSDPAVRAIVTVVAHQLVAASYTVSVPRSGGTVVPNVVVNATFDGLQTTLAQVTLSTVVQNPWVTLNPATGSVSVTPGAPGPVQTLTYQICENARLTNCSGPATVTVNVMSYVLIAGNDQARASNKGASTPIANVLANDTFGGARATLANVTLVQLSTSNKLIQLDPSTGSVNVLGKVSGSTNSVVYQICETGNLTNCSNRATVTLDMSGK